MRAAFASILLVAYLLCSVSPTRAQHGVESIVYANTGGGVADNHSGWLVGGGWALVTSRFLGSIEGGALIKFTEPPGYYRDSFSNGDSRCRNSRTGQFASNNSCVDAETRAGITVDANYLISRSETAPGMIFIGIGYRLLNAQTPYANLGYFWPPKYGVAFHVRGSAGRDFLQASAGIGFPLGGS